MHLLVHSIIHSFIHSSTLSRVSTVQIPVSGNGELIKDDIIDVDSRSIGVCVCV